MSPTVQVNGYNNGKVMYEIDFVGYKSNEVVNVILGKLPITNYADAKLTVDNIKVDGGSGNLVVILQRINNYMLKAERIFLTHKDSTYLK